ncbi:hypothetical protein LSTR_LSTR014448 [Laodelphax striatellus]|uniref:Uncharacterized protein n=1 Tax=Laodelphax striatellus TaxID=195883 RepID=A0A482WJR9_LAOST|nr:hypothetical protein LSTR_LSTR014448 [Laodelphax striatellus]
MKIYCKCLNVMIECQGSDFGEVDLSKLNLPSNDFFHEDLGTVELIGISKEQAVLVEISTLKNWVIHRCCNCDMFTHALNRDKGAASVLVNKELISDQSVITSLKNSDSYSPIFHIVVNYAEDDDVFTKVSGTDKNQAGISALHQQLLSYIQRESSATEERVRAYSDQQYALLENLRTRAHRDHRALTKLLSEVVAHDQSVHIQNTPVIKSSISPEVSSPIVLASASAAIRKPNVPIPAIGGGVRARLQPPAPRRLSESSHSNISFDSEALFPLEGMEDEDPDNYHTDEERSDTDESGSHDEGIHIPRRVGSFVYAKSLPMDVPTTFVPQRHRSGGGQEAALESPHPEDQEHPGRGGRSPRQPMDIAASIKALAKSVHGDTVFGDLPRPRFSSQI